ncbi:MAG: hypothetical protein RLZZ628_262 [Bacteroidota bacterium]|jgi:hypothetical protein
MKNLPIGIQSLSEIFRKKGIYVDKTKNIYQLVTQRKYVFLSRPRRFGKSLLVSTMKELFSGNQLLFKDLWIEDKWDWSQKNPVIHISFDILDYQNETLSVAIAQELKLIADSFNLTLTQKTFKTQFRELIMLLYQQQGHVVILIDEYDKPIVDYLDESTLKQAKANQKTAKSFYSVLKSLDTMLHFVFITGVSKFSKVSLFSDLNNLKDITLEPSYAALVGYTQAELEQYFGGYLQSLESELNISREKLIDVMGMWYNGYSWDGVTRIYNPFGILNFLSDKWFKNYWFETGSPYFLVQQMRKHAQFNVENTRVDSSFLDKYELDNIELVALLFQTGYLTIKSRNVMTGDMVLDYPNKEVRESMYKFVINHIAPNSRRTNTGLTMADLQNAFETKNLIRVRAIIDSLLADLPAETFKVKSEGLYHGLIHLIFKYLGCYIDSEVHSSMARADAVVQTDTHVYIFEFKFDETAKIAFKQIEDTKYADKYRASGKIIVGIGVNFNQKKRHIEDWIDEIL